MQLLVYPALDSAPEAPALILPCELDPLRHQSEEYATRLSEARVTTGHNCFDRLVHAAYRMPAVLPGARQMLMTSADSLTRDFEAAA